MRRIAAEKALAKGQIVPRRPKLVKSSGIRAATPSYACTKSGRRGAATRAGW